MATMDVYETSGVLRQVERSSTLSMSSSTALMVGGGGYFAIQGVAAALCWGAAKMRVRTPCCYSLPQLATARALMCLACVRFALLLGSLQLVQQNLRLPTQSEFSSFVWPVVDAVLVTNPYDLTRCVATTSQAARCAFRVGTTLKVVNAVPEMFGALYHGITVGLQFGVLVVFVVGLIAYARSHLEKVRCPPPLPLLLLLLLLLLCPKHAPS